jgi:hypothetical protein
MKNTVSGTFDVKLSPLLFEQVPAEALMGRRLIEKQFHGALDGTSIGEMLSVGTPTQGSAVYVAIERVTGTLDGKRGSFALYHTGVVDRGKASLEVRVVPDSGTGELAGVRGSLTIEIQAGGKHFYTFEYEIG